MQRLGGAGGVGASGIGAGGRRHGSPRMVEGEGSASRRRLSPLATEPEGSKPANTGWSSIFKGDDLSYQILEKIGVNHRKLLLSVNKDTHATVVGYCKENDVYNLNLLNVESTEEIHQKLIKMKDVNKIKITGLHDEAKFNSFIEELSKLSDVTFNTIQCDLSGNQLTDDQFQQMNNALLSKMNQLKSLNLEDNNIEAAGAVAIAQCENMKQITSLNLDLNNI